MGMIGVGLSIPEVALRGLSPYPRFSLALDFKNGIYRSGSVVASSPSQLPGWSYSRTVAKSELDTSGSLISFSANVPGIVPGVGLWVRAANTNLLLNNATLSTQSVAVTAQAYTLSFFGTGIVTLTGTATAGPLTGTGASNRVSLTFTPTAGTLTLTVSGSVTNAGLVAGSQAGPVIATAGAAVTVGADNPQLSTPMLADEDWIVTSTTSFQAAPGSAGDVPFLYSDGTVSNRDCTYRANGTGVLEIVHSVSGSTTTPMSGLTQAGAGRVTMIERHRAGKYSIAAKNSAGTIMVGSETTLGFPVGFNRLDIGNHLGAMYINAPLEFLGLMRGTFSDAALTALLGAA